MRISQAANHMHISAMKSNYGIRPLMEMVELLIMKQKGHESLTLVFYVSSAFGTRQDDVFIL